MSLLSAVMAQIIRSGGGPALWTPAEITTALWLDAADAATVTLTGSDIDQVADKSGNARHATPATATKPTYTASGINSLGSIVFGSGTDPLITPSFAPPAAADGLLAIGVFLRAGVPVNYSNLFTWGAVNAQLSLVIGSSAITVAQGRSKFFFRNDLTAGNTAITPEDTIVTSTPLIWAGAISNAAMDQWKNGTLLSGSTGAATRNLGGSAAITLGGSPDGAYATNRLQGQLGEYILVPADVTTTTRQRIEGYLAWKWGLEGDLPVDHPYKLAAPTTGAAVDPFFANVVSLLHMDGADASTTFTDVIGRTWTPSGNAQIDTAQSKFGGASGLFDGSGDVITTASSADFAYGTGDFTWECWLRLASTAGNQYIIEHGSNGGSITYNGGLKYYNITIGTGGALYTTGGGALTAGVWYHVALSRESGTTRFFVDGVLKSSAADGHNYGAQTLRLGQYGGGGFNLNGHLDDVRITKGVARYTAAFTPPTAPFPDA